MRSRLVALGGDLKLVHAALAADAGERPASESEDAAPQRLRDEITSVDGLLAQLRDRSEAVGHERDAAGEAVTAAASTLAAARGERDAAAERRKAAAEERRAARERLAERREQLLTIERELQDLELRVRGLTQQRANLEAARSAAVADVAPAHAALADAEAAERNLAATRGDRQAQLFGAERDLLESQSQLRELANRVQSLEQQLKDDGFVVDAAGVVRRPAPVEPDEADDADGGDSEVAGEQTTVALANGNPSPPPPSGGADVDPAELRDHIAELRGELRALGPVNLEAFEDLDEERDRHDFLSSQVDDLEAAEVQLREAIADLERRIRERFDETFVEVNTAFGEYFERFFGGGKAELVLVETPPDEDGEPGDAGVGRARAATGQARLLAAAALGRRARVDLGLAAVRAALGEPGAGLRPRRGRRRARRGQRRPLR